MSSGRPTSRSSPRRASPKRASPPPTGGAPRISPSRSFSPSDRLAGVHGKIAEYFAAGVRMVWLVEPAARVVYVYRSPHDVQVIGEDGELTGGDVLPGFRCPVRRLFP